MNTHVDPYSDNLRDVFTPEVIANLSASAQDNPRVMYRLGVLNASGPLPSDPVEAYGARVLRAQKAAWEAYLSAARKSGLFDPPFGKNLVARLTRSDDANFRSAMAECMTCWVLHSLLGHRVRGNPKGRRQSILDLRVELPDASVRVEVKAPQRESSSREWDGDDSDIIGRCLRDANKQLSHGVPNLVVVVPNLRSPVYSNRYQLIRALYGQRTIEFPIDTQTGAAVGSLRSRCSPDGEFLKKWSGHPRFTRIGAVMCVEESVDDQAEDFRIEHKVLVIHNPHSRRPIPRQIAGDFPQFPDETRPGCWTDGQRFHP